MTSLPRSMNRFTSGLWWLLVWFTKESHTTEWLNNSILYWLVISCVFLRWTLYPTCWLDALGLQKGLYVFALQINVCGTMWTEISFLDIWYRGGGAETTIMTYPPLTLGDYWFLAKETKKLYRKSQLKFICDAGSEKSIGADTQKHSSLTL